MGIRKNKAPAAVARKARRVIDFGDLPLLVGYNLRRAQLRVFQDFAAAVAGHDVTPGQFGVLTLIAANRGLNQSELGGAMGVDRSTVVTVIDKLESRRLVERRPAPKDRRSYALVLTPEGEALLARVRPLIQAHERRIGGALSAAEQAEMIRLLRRVAEG
jgi:DNA-binding MarR family transcriptional regulator